MKTGREYLAMMAEHDQKAWKEEFMEDETNQYGRDINVYLQHYLDNEYTSFSTFMSLSFYFNKTPQGHDYWWNLMQTIQ